MVPRTPLWGANEVKSGMIRVESFHTYVQQLPEMAD